MKAEDYRPSPLWQRLLDMGELHVHEIRTAGGVKRYEIMMTDKQGKGRPRKWCGTERCHRVKLQSEGAGYP